MLGACRQQLSPRHWTDCPGQSLSIVPSYSMWNSKCILTGMLPLL
jgi:hypothetical protein